MKNALRLLTFTAVTAICALPAFAQTTQPSPAAATPAATPNTVCIDLYNKWRESRNGDAATQKVAYQAGKDYLAQCGSDEYVKYVQSWVGKYDKASRDIEFWKAVDARNHAESFRLGRDLLNGDNENVRILVTLAYAGLLNATAGADKTNASLEGDALNYAQRAVQLIQAGKTTDNWAPFTNKDDALGWLNYALGVHNFKRATGESANYFIKAAQANSTTKQDPSTYYFLATAYQKAEYKPLADDYQATCAGKDLTDECKDKLNKMNLVVDRIIDAYARALSMAGTKPQFQAQKTEWMKSLTGFYKFRNDDKETGIDALIAGIQSKPLLLPSMQTMPAPSATPSTTPGTTTPSTGGNGSTTMTAPASTNGAKPTATTPAASTPKPAAGTQTKATAPAKPKPTPARP